jgi:hypothetical protein
MAQSLLPDPEFPGSAPKLLAPPLRPDERVAADGAFKTPGLRNVELTAPYFHNGGTSTLVDVVRFYNWGGGSADFSGVKSAAMVPLLLTDKDQADLVEFLRAPPIPASGRRAPLRSSEPEHRERRTPGIFTTLLGFPVLDDRPCIPPQVRPETVSRWDAGLAVGKLPSA